MGRSPHMTSDLRERLAAHPYFTAWTDPMSGVESFVLTHRVAPMHKGWYYANPSVSADQRWFWFRAAFPPSRSWFQAVVCLDPDAPSAHLLHGSHCGSGNALLTPEGDRAYVPVEDGIHLMGPGVETETVWRFPREHIGTRQFRGLCTTLTASADGRFWLLDSRVGDRWLIGLVERATGEYRLLRAFNRSHHHAMFSPTDPRLFMVSHGPGNHETTGDRFDMNVRMWLMDTELTRYEPVLPDLWFGQNSWACHEWWMADGRIAWCDYEAGVHECDPVGVYERRRRLVWPRKLIHAHADPAGRYYAGDHDPYKWSDERPCQVWFFDRQSGLDIAVASAMPTPRVEPGDRRAWHLDPHCHFTPDGQGFVWTTTVLGPCDVAITPVEGAVRRLEAAGRPASL